MGESIAQRRRPWQRCLGNQKNEKRCKYRWLDLWEKRKDPMPPKGPSHVIGSTFILSWKQALQKAQATWITKLLWLGANTAHLVVAEFQVVVAHNAIVEVNAVGVCRRLQGWWPKIRTRSRQIRWQITTVTPWAFPTSTAEAILSTTSIFVVGAIRALVGDGTCWAAILAVCATSNQTAKLLYFGQNPIIKAAPGKVFAISQFIDYIVGLSKAAMCQSAQNPRNITILAAKMQYYHHPRGVCARAAD